MAKPSLQDARLIALSLLGGVALTYPVISLFSRDAMIFGIPSLYAYVYGVWALLAALARLATRGQGRSRRPC